MSEATPAQQSLLELGHIYGLAHELKTRSRTDTSSTHNQFDYDDELRLTGATTTGAITDTETFALDAVANRTSHSRTSGAWAYDANNRLTQAGTGPDAPRYTWDDAGNLTQRSEGSLVTTFGYDSSNRLAEVRINGALAARYGYDPQSRRLWREQYRDRQGAPLAQAQRTLYLYADEGLLAEATQAITLQADQTVTATAAPQISTQYGLRPEAPFSTGVLFVKTRNSNGQDSFAYLHHDHLGTPIAASDKQGRLVWAARYTPFGQASLITSAPTPEQSTIALNLRLPGQYFDPETGLHYNWNRYYDPSTGRYTQEDPIGLEGGVNRYAYVRGDPLGYTDPEGLFPWWAVIGGAATGFISAYQRGLDPCSSDIDVLFAFGGGFASGFIGGIMPIASKGPMVSGLIGGAIARGAAGGYFGSQASNIISNRGDMSGVGSNHNSAMASAYVGGAFGAFGNLAGLGMALTNVRSGFGAKVAIANGDGVGTAVGVLGGVLDAGGQFRPPDNAGCECKR